MSVIEVRGLRRTYGDFVAVRDFDLTVEAGECVAMLGPNGAGKTTTVEILEGFRHRDAGDVTVLGVDPAHASRAWRAQIGIVAQAASDLNEVTVREALAHFRRFYPRPRTVAETVELVGLNEKVDARVAHLSGGQRRRLDVALGVIGQPEVLFLDEPTTGFDPEARRTFWKLVDLLKAEGVTILLTTHYLEEADALADRVVVIAKGVRVADTTPRELGNRNANMVTVAWREDDAHHEERTETPTAFVAALAARLGAEVPGLEVRRTTLEEAYLALVQDETTEEAVA